jgi:hypothetical protein
VRASIHKARAEQRLDSLRVKVAAARTRLLASSPFPFPSSSATTLAEAKRPNCLVLLSPIPYSGFDSPGDLSLSLSGRLEHLVTDSWVGTARLSGRSVSDSLSLRRFMIHERLLL